VSANATDAEVSAMATLCPQIFRLRSERLDGMKYHRQWRRSV
jgi:hypothetical protein